MTTENTERENDLQCELAAWELLREARRERDEARTTIEDAKRALNATDYEGILLAAMRVKEERDEAREWQNVKITKNGETHCLGTLIELLERENAKLHDIVERAINYLDQSYRDGFADEASDLRYELEQLTKEAK